jgi:hypothetical protein
MDSLFWITIYLIAGCITALLFDAILKNKLGVGLRVSTAVLVIPAWPVHLLTFICSFLFGSKYTKEEAEQRARDEFSDRDET